jgi:hypothetical protein
MKDIFRFALLPLALAGCLAEPEEPDLSDRTDNLFIPTGVARWAPGQAIRVCWVTVTLPGETLPASALQAAKDQFREDLKNSWERWANISFTGFNECPTSGSDPYVRIQIRWQGIDANHDGYPDESGGACGLGAGTYQLPGPVSTTSDNAGLSCGVGPDHRYNDTSLPQATKDWIRTRWRYVAVHEMGHVLGFDHEQDRTDNNQPASCARARTTGTYLTAYDWDSVMNYCGPNDGTLTRDDIRGVIATYGRRVPGPSMFFNGFEGTDANAWWFAGNANVDRNIGYGRTGQNNGWAANWKDWNADNVYVRTGGAHHRCDVEVQTRFNGAPANHQFWILDNPGTSGWFDWTATMPNVYRPVKFSFDATADTHILVAGFWGNNSAVHYQQIDDVTVNCSGNLSRVAFDRYWTSGTSFLISADHLAPGAAYVRYENVPVAGGGFATRSGNYVYPDANGNVVNAQDMALSTQGLTCTPQQLASKIYATIVDGSSTTSKTISIPARLLCFNG